MVIFNYLVNLRKKLIGLVILFTCSVGFSQTVLINGVDATTCSGNFYDSGGAGGSYANNQYEVITICPSTPGAQVVLNFSAFNVEAGWDFLCVYNGTSTAAPSLGCYDNDVPLSGLVQGSNPSGCLTFEFDSDGSVTLSGWAATISCSVPCQTITSNFVSSTPAISGGVIQVCQGQNVTLTGSGNFSSSGAGATYQWDFGDGFVAPNGTSATHAYANPGIYYANLNITDPNGCENTNDLNVVIQVSTDPIFNGSFVTDPVICLGETNTLTGDVTPIPFTLDCTPPVSGTTFLPDGSGVSYSTCIDVDCFASGQTMTSMANLQNICAVMEHSYLGDLQIEIICPNGQTVILKSYAAGGGGTYLGSPLDDPSVGPGVGANYCFSMSGATTLTAGPTVITGTPPSASIQAGTYQPQQSFAGLVGCPLNGDWCIEVTDNLGADNGYIFSWGLEFAPGLAPSNTTFTPTIASEGWVPDPSIISGTNPITVQPTTDGQACYDYQMTDNFGCTYDTTICFTVLPLTDPSCPNCVVTNFTANIGACVVGPSTYSTTGQVEFNNPPVTGQLIVEDCNSVQQVFNAPFVSPVNYNLTGQTANGAACDVTAYFTDDVLCTQTIAYTAPVCLCNIDNFTATIGACLSNNTFEITGDVFYSSPPASGSLVIEVDNGTSTFTTTIPAPFTSPDSYTVPGIPADGSAITITVFFSADPTCTNSINATAPPSCDCDAEIGTFTATITGSSTNNYILCYGDQIDINSNMDFTPPAEQFAPPGPPYDPGVSWLIYSCPPSVALVPNLLTDVPDDPCLLGLASDFNLSDLNDLGMINAFPPGTFTNNTIYYVPITMYSMSDGTYSYVNTTMPCYELGTPFAVQYLPEFNFAIVEDCNNGTATITVSGGLPELDGTNFTASNLLPATANFTSTTTTNNGTFVINGLNGGENYSFTVNDGNGCPYVITGGPFPPLQNPAFSYALTALCVTSGSINPVITGVPGGTFSATPAGLSINASTGQITPTTSAVGTYDVTYTTPGPCPDDQTVVIDIINAPIANAGPDVSICPGSGITLNGSGLGTPTWSPGGTLSATNILNPVATPGSTTTYTLTLDASGCIDSDDVTVTILNPAPIVVSPDVSICEGDCTTLTVAGGDFFVWDADPQIIDSSLTNQTVCPVTTTTYAVTSYTVGSNMVTNGDFSSGNAGFNSSYTFTNPTNTGAAQYNVIPNPQTYNGGFSPCTDHTTGAGNMMVINGSTVAGSTVWCQTIPVTQNTDYLFSAWLASVHPTNPAILQFSINGVQLGANLTGSTTTCVWDEFFTTWNSGAATSATICIVNQNTAASGNDFALDDISFSPVCEQTGSVTVTVNPLPLVDAGADQTLCDGDPTVLNASGALSYVWDNGVTDGVSFTPATTLTYTVLGTGTGGCEATDQVTVTVNPIPVVNAGPDQVICIGDPVILSGSGAGVGAVYAWDNSVTDGVSFNPAATNTYTVTGTNTALCSATDMVTVTVNPLDDPSFNYPSGLTYCETAADPTPLITGLSGGTFSYTVVSGGPTLVLNNTSGSIDLSASNQGTYTITYNTTGAPGSLCPQSSSLSLTITDAPVADFNFGIYCSNEIDPSPNFINGGTGGTFSASPAGLSINPATGLVDLSASTPGIYTVTNTINIAGCALASFDSGITVNGLPDATISGTAIICPEDALPDVTVDIISSAAPWTLIYNFNGVPVSVGVTPPSPFIINGAAIGSYDLVSVTDANGCMNTVTGNATISSFPSPVMSPLNDQEICEGQNLSTQVFGSNIAGSTFDWVNITGTDIGFGLTGVGNIPIFLAQNGTGNDITVTVQVTPTSPQGCEGTPINFDITIHANPIVSFEADTLEGCSPFVVNFTNTTSIAGQDCIWNFGTGPLVYGCGTVTNTFSTGSYDVTLSVTSVDGCYGTGTETNYINVFDTPEAAFTYAPHILDIDDTEVEFTNLSDFADSYQWDFGDTTPFVYQINPSHTYPVAPNTYLATLIASNNSGMCADTAQQFVTIQDVLIFYVPNVFTPDHDEFNEGFIPIFTSGYDPFDYHLTIFNRWGEIIFESFDASVGWDGTYSDQGLVQDGVYIWQIEFKETMSDKRHTHRGHVTVLK